MYDEGKVSLFGLDRPFPSHRTLPVSIVEAGPAHNTGRRFGMMKQWSTNLQLMAD